MVEASCGDAVAALSVPAEELSAEWALHERYDRDGSASDYRLVFDGRCPYFIFFGAAALHRISGGFLLNSSLFKGREREHRTQEGDTTSSEST